MEIVMWFRSSKLAFIAVILTLCLSACGTPAGQNGTLAGQNNVTWEFEGDDIRVIESLVDGERDRRSFFPATAIEEVSTSDHLVTVRSGGETFKIHCFDKKQATDLASVLQKAQKLAEN